MFLKELLVFALRLQIETEKETTQYDALISAIKTITKKHLREEGITARDAVIHLMECTFLLPGVFNVQMLSWRQRLQDIVHAPQEIHASFSGYSSLNYVLPLSFEVANGLPTIKSVATQTKLVNPNSNEITEFHTREFRLKWVLQS